MWNPFKKKASTDDSIQPTGDMRDTPTDNPLDYREDGSIRKGDPSYDFMMSILDSGKAGIATQNPDGTWSTELIDDEKEED